MRKKTVMRKYKMSDANLKQLADNLILSINRDEQEFMDRGFNATKQNDFKSLIQAFDDLPSDEQLEGIKVAATENKDTCRKVLEKALRTIFLMAKNVFKEGTGKYKEFGNANVSQQTDEELVRNAKITESAANKYLQDLADEGLTAQRIYDLTAARQALDDAIDEQTQAIRKRDVTTESRIEAGNALYDTVVKYSAIGKDIWYDENEAKYNDYVIYETTTEPTKPTDDPTSTTEA